MKSKPANQKLYNQVKEEGKRKFEHWPSAYGSQWLVKTYKQRGGTYVGEKPSGEQGVSRWIKEDWRDEKGNVCGSNKNKNTKKCRPSKRITKDTPVTWNEIDSKEKERLIKEKKKVGMGKRASPARRTMSPKRKTMSPKRKTMSPKRKTMSPKRKTMSPSRRTMSPKKKNTKKSK